MSVIYDCKSRKTKQDIDEFLEWNYTIVFFAYIVGEASIREDFYF